MGIGKLKVVIAMLLFGSIGLMVKNIELTSSEIALYRGVLGSLFLLIFSLFKKKKISIAVLKSNAVPLLVSGAAIGLNWILLFEAYNYTTIANATLSYYFAPVIVMIVSPFFPFPSSEFSAFATFPKLIDLSGVRNERHPMHG